MTVQITAISDDTGSAGDGVTQDTTLVIFGTGEAYDTINLSRDGIYLGTATVDDAGSWTFDHTAEVLSPGTYTFSASSAAGSASYTVTVEDTHASVEPTPVDRDPADPSPTPVEVIVVNPPAQASDDHITVVANDGPQQLEVLTNDGGDGALFVVSSGSSSYGASVSVENGRLLYDPSSAYAFLAAGESANDQVGYTMQDGAGAQSSATAYITVTGQNDAPSLSGPITLATGRGAVTVADALSGYNGDNDHDALVGVAVTGLTAGSGSWSYSTNGGASWQVVGPVTGSAGLLLRGSDLLQFTPDGAGMPAQLSVRAWDQTAGSAGDVADTSVNGGTSAFSSTETTLSVRGAPIAVAVTGEANEDGPAVTLAALVENGSDGSSYSIDTSATRGRVVSNGDGTFSYATAGAFDRLKAGETTTDSFDYTVTDPTGVASTATATVTVHGANDAPSLSPRTDLLSAAQETLNSFGNSNTAYYAQSFTADATILTNVRFALRPEWGDDFHFHVLVTDVTGTSGALRPTVVLFESEDQVLSQRVAQTDFSIATGSLSLEAGHTYAVVLDARASFASGIFGGSLSVGNPASYSDGEFFYHNVSTPEESRDDSFAEIWNAYPSFDMGLDLAYAPVPSRLSTISEDEGAGAGKAVSTLISTWDADADALSGVAVTGSSGEYGVWQFSRDGGDSWQALGTVSDASALLLTLSDLVRFRPDGEHGTEASLTFRAWDQTTGTAGGRADASLNGGTTAFSAERQVADLTVSDVNDAPVGVPDRYVAVRNEAVTISAGVGLLVNDRDVDQPHEALSVTSHTAPAHGSLVLDADGSFTYTPDDDYVGSDSFAYTIADGAGGTSSPATVTITVQDRPPALTAVLLHDTGSSSDDSVTSDGRLLVGGVQPGATVQYSADGVTYEATPISDARDGLQDGTKIVHVRQVDPYGYASAATEIHFTLDTVAPGKPASVGTNVMSATQSRFGASAVKLRSTRSGADRASRSRRVVVGPRRRLTPARAASHISRATRLRPTASLSAFSSA